MSPIGNILKESTVHKTLGGHIEYGDIERLSNFQGRSFNHVLGGQTLKSFELDFANLEVLLGDNKFRRSTRQQDHRQQGKVGRQKAQSDSFRANIQKHGSLPCNFRWLDLSKPSVAQGLVGWKG